MNTSFSNNIRDGHRGNTEIDLGDRRVLTVSTRKLNSSLVTSASVSLVEGGQALCHGLWRRWRFQQDARGFKA